MAKTDFDVIVVGGGISGLAAGWTLRHRNLILLEAGARVGGRISSVSIDQRWVNFGAHLVSPGGHMQAFAQQFGVPVIEPPGHTVTAVAMGTRIIRVRRPELLPLRLPLSLEGRVSLVRAGMRRLAAHRRAALADSCGLVSAHVTPPRLPADERLDGMTFGELLGDMQRDAKELMRIIANRAAAELTTLSAQYAVLTATGAGGVRRLNVIGGTEELITAIHLRLGSRVRTSANVIGVTQDRETVYVDVQSQSAWERLTARACLVAVPAPAVRRIVSDLPPEKDAGLGAVRYGPYVVAGIFTTKTEPLPWSDLYALIVPRRSFCLLFNSSNASLRTGPALGSSFVVYAGGDRAAEMLSESDGFIGDRFLRDLYEIAPELRGTVRELIVKRWPLGGPISAPGRSRLQPQLAASVGRIFFAGDYIGHPGMESAAETGIEAARIIDLRLREEEAGRP